MRTVRVSGHILYTPHLHTTPAQVHSWDIHPPTPVNRMTDTGKNITFASRSVINSTVVSSALYRNLPYPRRYVVSSIPIFFHSVGGLGFEVPNTFVHGCVNLFHGPRNIKT